MAEPNLSVILPWRDRAELQSTLFSNADWFDSTAAEIVIVNCGGDADLLCDCVKRSPLTGVRVVEIKSPTFNRSLSLNIGANLCHGRLLFNLDCDMIISHEFITTALSLNHDEVFVTVERIFESDPAPMSSSRSVVLSAIKGSDISEILKSNYIEIRFVDGSSTKIRTTSNELLHDYAGGGGSIVVKKDHLVKIGGYNSGLWRWGWEDDDFVFRLQKRLGLRRAETGHARHLSHKDDKRAMVGGTASENNAKNMAYCVGRYSCGDLDGTFSDDISNWSFGAKESVFP